MHTDEVKALAWKYEFTSVEVFIDRNNTRRWYGLTPESAEALARVALEWVEERGWINPHSKPWNEHPVNPNEIEEEPK
jgi:hypothetical protein